ncbi:MAG: hypothetical protein ACK53W_12560 [Gemmatimonadota bacterium]
MTAPILFLAGLLASAAAGGLLYRARGTGWRELFPWWPLGTLFNRTALWGLPIGLAAWGLYGPAAWIEAVGGHLPAGGGALGAVVAVALTYAGLLIPHGVFQGRTSSSDKSVAEAFIGMSTIGFARGWIIAQGLAPDAYWPCLIGGALMGAAYWIGHRSPWPDWRPWVHPRSTEPAEFLTGAAIWAALFISA